MPNNGKVPAPCFRHGGLVHIITSASRGLRHSTMCHTCLRCEYTMEVRSMRRTSLLRSSSRRVMLDFTQSSSICYCCIVPPTC